MPSLFFRLRRFGMFRLTYIVIIVLSGCMLGNSTIAETGNSNSPEVSKPIRKDLALTTELNQALDQKAQASEVSLHSAEMLAYRNLVLRLIKVEDSRCPQGTACIWAGQIIVMLEVSNDSGEKMEVKLIRKRESEVVNALGYQLYLLDVEPHPKEGKAILESEQIIKLKIVKSQLN